MIRIIIFNCTRWSLFEIFQHFFTISKEFSPTVHLDCSDWIPQVPGASAMGPTAIKETVTPAARNSASPLRNLYAATQYARNRYDSPGWWDPGKVLLAVVWRGIPRQWVVYDKKGWSFQDFIIWPLCNRHGNSLCVTQRFFITLTPWSTGLSYVSSIILTLCNM